jgi:hypothetical protein
MTAAEWTTLIVAIVTFACGVTAGQYLERWREMVRRSK